MKVKQEKRIAVIVMVGALVVLGWFFAKWMMKKKSGEGGSDSGSGSGSSGGGGGSSSGGSSVFPLKRNSRGSEVRCLQRWLTDTKNGITPGMLNWTGTTVYSHPAVTEDGIFGPKTEASFKAATGYTACSKDYYDKMKIYNH